MTLEQLQAMSDAELNELAAIKILWGGIVNVPSDNWKPTTDMNDAWMLVKIMHDDSYGFALGNIDDEWSAWFIEPNLNSHKDEGRVTCKEASRAITIAAILAKVEQS